MAKCCEAERKVMESDVDEVKRQAYAQIVSRQVRASKGASNYPDATLYVVVLVTAW